MNHINRDEVFNNHFGGTLPELQPGRELTAGDIENVVNGQTKNWLAPETCSFVAAELNKIRAPKTCAEPQSYIKALEKERDDAKSLNGHYEIEVCFLKADRDGLKAQLESVKSQPVGVTKEQVQAALIETTGAAFCDETLEEIAAALSPKWIKCADRMPENGESVWFFGKNFDAPMSGFFDNGRFSIILPYEGVTHWMPRHVPNPPEEEESEQIKRLREAHSKGGITLEKAIEIAKEFEKGAKK